MLATILLWIDWRADLWTRKRNLSYLNHPEDEHADNDEAVDELVEPEERVVDDGAGQLVLGQVLKAPE